MLKINNDFLKYGIREHSAHNVLKDSLKTYIDRCNYLISTQTEIAVGTTGLDDISRAVHATSGMYGLEKCLRTEADRVKKIIDTANDTLQKKIFDHDPEKFKGVKEKLGADMKNIIDELRNLLEEEEKKEKKPE